MLGSDFYYAHVTHRLKGAREFDNALRNSPFRWAPCRLVTK
jgi:hypothetical protein